MAQHSFIRSAGGVLVPFASDSQDYVNKLKVGAVVSVDIKQVRNPKFHRKFFSLLNLGFQYWEPKGGAISPADKALVSGFAKWVAHHTGHEDTLQELANQYLDDAAKKRAGNISAVKSFEAFRAWATIEADFYVSFLMPDGSIRREPKSISFAKMDEAEFSELYSAVLNVLWNYILYRTFPDQQSAENAAAQLLEYAA